MIYNIDDDNIKKWIEGETKKIKIEDDEKIKIYNYYKKENYNEKEYKIINEINLCIIKIREYIKNFGIDEYTKRYIEDSIKELKEKHKIIIKYKVNKGDKEEKERKIEIKDNKIKMGDIEFDILNKKNEIVKKRKSKKR